MTTAAPPNARSDCGSPDTTNAPGPSPNSSASPARAQRREVDARAEAAREAALRERDCEPALGDVVGGAQRARAHALPHGGVERAQLAEVGLRQLAERRLAAQLRQLGAGAPPAPTSRRR